MGSSGAFDSTEATSVPSSAGHSAQGETFWVGPLIHQQWGIINPIFIIIYMCVYIYDRGTFRYYFVALLSSDFLSFDLIKLIKLITFFRLIKLVKLFKF